MSGPTVEARDEQDDVALSPQRWAELAREVLVAEGVAGGELALTFVDEATIAALNARYLDGEGPTDVLSFPMEVGGTGAEGPSGPGVVDDGPPVLLGDVVICPAYARGQVGPRGGDLDDELALLVVHGVLHLLGHDHAEEVEAARMRERERDLLARYHRRCSR